MARKKKYISPEKAVEIIESYAFSKIAENEDWVIYDLKNNEDLVTDLFMELDENGMTVGLAMTKNAAFAEKNLEMKCKLCPEMGLLFCTEVNSVSFNIILNKKDARRSYMAHCVSADSSESFYYNETIFFDMDGVYAAHKVDDAKFGDEKLDKEIQARLREYRQFLRVNNIPDAIYLPGSFMRCTKEDFDHPVVYEKNILITPDLLDEKGRLPKGMELCTFEGCVLITRDSGIGENMANLPTLCYGGVYFRDLDHEHIEEISVGTTEMMFINCHRLKSVHFGDICLVDLLTFFNCKSFGYFNSFPHFYNNVDVETYRKKMQIGTEMLTNEIERILKNLSLDSIKFVGLSDGFKKLFDEIKKVDKDDEDNKIVGLDKPIDFTSELNSLLFDGQSPDKLKESEEKVTMNDLVKNDSKNDLDSVEAENEEHYDASDVTFVRKIQFVKCPSVTEKTFMSISDALDRNLKDISIDEIVHKKGAYEKLDKTDKKLMDYDFTLYFDPLSIILNDCDGFRSTKFIDPRISGKISIKKCKGLKTLNLFNGSWRDGIVACRDLRVSNCENLSKIVLGKAVVGNMVIQNCDALKDFRNCPKRVLGTFHASYNKGIKSLEGLPKECGIFYLDLLLNENEDYSGMKESQLPEKVETAVSIMQCYKDSNWTPPLSEKNVKKKYSNSDASVIFTNRTK